MCMYHVNGVLREPPETEVIRGCQPPYGFQDMNPLSFAKATNALIH